MNNYSSIDTPSHLELQEAVISMATALRIVEMFSVLADPTRLRIISALAHQELNVSDLSALIGMTASATSHQLRVLRAQRIVRSRKDGRQVFYFLDDNHIHDLLDRAVAHVQHE